MNNGQMDHGNENPTQHLPWWLRKTTKKPQSGWSAPGFEPGTSRTRVSLRYHGATSLGRSILYVLFFLKKKTVMERLENEQSCLQYNEQRSFSNLSVTSPTSQIILQPFRRFTPTSQLILQPFRCFTYVTVHSPTLLSLLLRHKLFTSGEPPILLTSGEWNRSEIWLFNTEVPEIAALL